MTYAAGIIGHILVRDWICTRQTAGTDHHGMKLAQPSARFHRAWSGRTGNHTPSWPGYVASVRQMSAGLSRRVPFRRQR